MNESCVNLCASIVARDHRTSALLPRGRLGISMSNPHAVDPFHREDSDILKAVLMLPDGVAPRIEEDIAGMIRSPLGLRYCIDNASKNEDFMRRRMCASGAERTNDEAEQRAEVEATQTNEGFESALAIPKPDANGEPLTQDETHGSVKKPGSSSFKRKAKRLEAEVANVLTQHARMGDELRRKQREARLVQLVRDLSQAGMRYQAENERLNSEVQALRKRLAEAKPFQRSATCDGEPRGSPLPLVPSVPSALSVD